MKFYVFVYGGLEAGGCQFQCQTFHQAYLFVALGLRRIKRRWKRRMEGSVIAFVHIRTIIMWDDAEMVLLSSISSLKIVVDRQRCFCD